MFETRFTQKFGVKYPIMQGAIAFLSGPELAAAVSNAGGLGTMATSIVNTEAELRDAIRKTRSLTDKPFAVNVPMFPGVKPISEERMAQIVIEEGVPIVETVSAGLLPDKILSLFKGAGVKIIHKCPKVRHALMTEPQGVDAIALLCFGAGGHPGVDEISLMVQIPRAVETLKVPVIAAGGIADARGFVAALALGADAVLMGTRFLTALECPVHPRIREWLLKAREEDVALVGTSLGNPSRAMKNQTALDIMKLEKQGAHADEIRNLRSGPKLVKALKEGDAEGAPLSCGQVVGLIGEILPAKEIIDQIIREAPAIIARLDSLVKKNTAR